MNLPQRVMATPIGQMLKPMFDQMQTQMSSIHGSHEIANSGVYFFNMIRTKPFLS